ncbi:LysR family transcriptional regulator [Bradyrhizobium sp. WD16]|uniref:LysR family transcriptional regulator n=1 Tax=Bradyrhizobium sp. WD16 TaxID=1521768 RepID=UPI0020A5A393|nr:LysR family transcriptional regulator [Bradyrhizobium sp. WD16]UTD25964.1 LysR family transcriptional regulator [Bradyrhizobium sp. WD16]
MDRLDGLRSFIKVVEFGSFSEAGRALRLSRSAVSKHVGDLEDDLGVQLLNRTTRHVAPTDAGQAYYERVVAILADLDAADSAVTDHQASPRGLLRVNAPMSFGTLQLGPAIADFMSLYPELRLQLTLSDAQIDPVQEGLDVTLRIAELEASSLIARKIMPVERVVCAAPAYLERHGVPRHPAELRDHACLTYGFLSTGNQWKLSGKDGDHWIQPSWTLCANNAEVLRDAAIGGRGIALLPTFLAADALAGGELRAFLSDYQAPPLALYAVYPPTRSLAVKVRLFIDFLVERFGPRRREARKAS